GHVRLRAPDPALRALLHLVGLPVEMEGDAPLARGQSLAVAVSTYRDRVHYGLVADAEAVPDLDRFAHALTAEVETLITACGS
ncbi:WS/DGAT domain-containing protein, partial [Streptomyces sp. NPDC002920]